MFKKTFLSVHADNSITIELFSKVAYSLTIDLVAAVCDNMLSNYR